MPISDIAMASFGYSHNFASHIQNEHRVHYTDNTINSYSDDIKDIIDDFKKKKNISTPLLNYNGRFYTPILNGELKYVFVTEGNNSTNCLNVSINKIDINNRSVIVIHPDQGQDLRANKCLLYSAKINYNYLALIKCNRNYSFKSALDKFESIRNDSEHPFNKLMHNSSYKYIAKIGIYPSDTAILCSHCSFNIKYNELTQETSNPINIIALHKTFIKNTPIKEATSYHIFEYCAYDLLTHEKNGNKHIDHYHPINLNRLTISDILQSFNSKVTVYSDCKAYYFGKFNLETLDRNYLQNTLNLSIESNIIAETAF